MSSFFLPEKVVAVFTRCLLTYLLYIALSQPSSAIDWATVETEIENESLYLSPQWQALLHISEGRRWIDTDEFLLSHGDFSFQREMEYTLAYLYSDDNAVCRFPARYQWLKNQLPMLPEKSLQHCDELQTFLRNAPADEVALVFASENLKSPSSMMGHVFLNIAGQRSSGEEVEYSVSFFTNIDTWNVPRVFYESIVTGRPGYFSLSPYQDQVLRYLHEENRNVWRYQLAMTPAERQITQYHLFELRDIQLTYYFHAYNCATLINFVVAHSEPDLLASTQPWVTPLGVIRESEQLVEEISLRPSTQWLVRAYSESLPSSLVTEIRDDILDSPTLDWMEPLKESENGLLALETARAYNDYRFESQALEQAQWEQNEVQLAELATRHFAGLSLDLSDYKDPLKSPKERQWQLGYSYQASNNYLQVSFLPASHRLDDDNRQYFGESGLQVGELSLLLDPSSGNTRVEHFRLYGMQSLMPRHPMMSQYSASIGVGYEQHYDSNLMQHGAWYAEGMLGQTWRLHRSIDVYGLIGGGAAYASGDSYLYAKPTIGLFVRQANRGKLHAELSAYFNQVNNADYLQLSLTQSIFTSQNSSWIINAQNRYSRQARADDYQFSIAFKRYF